MTTGPLKGVKIAVMMGGVSDEREISLKTGTAVLSALKAAGYDAHELRYDGPAVAGLLGDMRPDVVFVALHGRFGEDGKVQGMLEVLGIRYTGSGVTASAVAMDKTLTKKLLMVEGVNTPGFESLKRGDEMDTALPPPVVVKPVKLGSTIGMSFVFDAGDMRAAIDKAFVYDDEVLVEKYIKGRELTVSVIDGEPLPVVEIEPKGGVYDYEAKYNSADTVYTCPANIDDSVRDELQATAARVYGLVGCSGAARVDFRLGEDGMAYVLEINTIPGMTETSLLPKAAAASGMDFTALIERMLESAIRSV